jgi:cytochrome P450
MLYPGEVLLGKSFGAFDGHDEAPFFIQHLDNMFLVWALCGVAPLLYRLLALLPFKKLQRFLASGDYFYQVSISTRHSHLWQSGMCSLLSQYGADAVNEYIKLHGRATTRRSLLTKLIAGDPATSTEPLSDAEISDEVSNLTFAATDTTGNTMTYALYRLSCQPELQERLRTEIKASGAIEAGFAFQALQALPILNGVVMETLRFYPAIPSALLRVTAAKETVIGGLTLPQDVSCPAS